jgi:hypothetical protein
MLFNILTPASKNVVTHNVIFLKAITIYTTKYPIEEEYL